MYIEDYLSVDYPVFSEGTSVSEAIYWADEFGFSHIFVQRETYFYGAIPVEFLYDPDIQYIGEVMMYAEKFGITENSPLTDSLRLFHTFNTNVVPVVSQTEHYMGYLSYDDVFSELSKYPIFSENGAMLLIECPPNAYSMTEIARIIESNGTQFYGGYITEINDIAIRFLMRISSDNLASIYNTLERFGYTIVHKFYQDTSDEMIRERYSFFQKYLDL